jgi:hypothetical protein
LLSTAVASADKTLIDALAIHADVQLCAFYKWEAAGKPGGADVRFWLEAEEELVRGPGEAPSATDDGHADQPSGTKAVGEKQDNWGRGNSQDADRHSGIRHPHSTKV